MPIRIEKHCRLHPEPEDGTRILVMRFWPRGVRKDRFDVWARNLAPSAELLRWAIDRRGQLTPEMWTIWVEQYRSEMALQSASITDLRQRHEAGETITLLCGCHSNERCHRRLLRDLILEEECP